jgi:hypothetical protein
MKILTKLEEIIKTEFRVDATKGSYFLVEEAEENYPKTQIKQRGKMLVYSFDKHDSNDSVFPIFNAKIAGLTAINDYLIFYPKHEKLFIFICDLKTKSASATKQLNSGKALASYIINMAIKQMNFLPVSVEFRGLIFIKDNNPMLKSSTNPQKYSVLGKSKLAKQILKAGIPCYLDRLCF